MNEQPSSTLAASTRDERADGAAKLPGWWHLGQSVVTRCCKAPVQLPSERRAIHPPVRQRTGFRAWESVSPVSDPMG